jgi:hypothetical protein
MANKDDAKRSGELDPDSHIFLADTVPPPASGDAYSAETVVRTAPPELLDAARARKALRPPKVQILPEVPTPRERPPPLTAGAEIPSFALEEEGLPVVWEAPAEIAEAVRKTHESGSPTGSGVHARELPGVLPLAPHPVQTFVPASVPARPEPPPFQHPPLAWPSPAPALQPRLRSSRAMLLVVLAFAVLGIVFAGLAVAFWSLT